MVLFRRFFYWKPPDRLLEISGRVLGYCQENEEEVLFLAQQRSRTETTAQQTTEQQVSLNMQQHISQQSSHQHKAACLNRSKTNHPASLNRAETQPQKQNSHNHQSRNTATTIRAETQPHPSEQKHSHSQQSSHQHKTRTAS